MEQEIEGAVWEMVQLCSWMTDEDVGRFRRLFRVLLGVESDEWGGVVAEESFALWRRSSEVGDRRREWAFYYQYCEACAFERGEEYRWPEMPVEIAQLP